MWSTRESFLSIARLENCKDRSNKQKRGDWITLMVCQAVTDLHTGCDIVTAFAKTMGYIWKLQTFLVNIGTEVMKWNGDLYSSSVITCKINELSACSSVPKWDLSAGVEEACLRGLFWQTVLKLIEATVSCSLREVVNQMQICKLSQSGFTLKVFHLENWCV